MNAKSSRLNRSKDKTTKRQIIFFAIAIIVLLFILSEFGPFALSSVAGLMSGLNKQTGDKVTNEKSTLEAPFINSIPDATDSAVIKVSGSSTYSDAEVELYVNGELYDTVPLSSDQKFVFDTVELTEGNNTINARVKKGNSYSDETRSYTVTYSKGEPLLEVSSPSDGQEFKVGDQTILVQGKTNPENTVTVNSFRAIVDDDGTFTYNLGLKDGDNDIKIQAIRPGGSKTEKDLRVKYSP
jgi:osmotically-inducible protein OsmY